VITNFIFPPLYTFSWIRNKPPGSATLGTVHIPPKPVFWVRIGLKCGSNPALKPGFAVALKVIFPKDSIFSFIIKNVQVLVRTYESDDHLTEKQVRSKRNTGALLASKDFVDVGAFLQCFIQESDGGEPLLPSLTLERAGLEVRVDGVVGAAQVPNLPRGADQTLPLFCSLRAH
jgi:hypothetical protein